MSEKNLELNRLISKIYRVSTKLEEKSLCLDRNINLTINELHLLECIKKNTKGDDGPTISSIAAELDITRPSTTVAVNKLNAKKFVDKIGCVNDGRSVRIKLTGKGEKAYALYTNYHNEISEELNKCFTDEEKAALGLAFEKINNFFTEKLTEKEAEEFDF